MKADKSVVAPRCPELQYPSRLSDELRFICLCCMQHRTPDQDRVLFALAATIDWSRVVAISARHRVDGLVQRALRQNGIHPPAECRMQLERKARGIALHGMALAAETQRLCDLAETADLSPVVLKGTPLALLAYGTVHTKHAKDIDLAVSPNDRAAMRMVLTGAGYLATGTPNGKDESWYHPGKRIQVELHIALVDHSSWLPGLVPGPDLPRQWVGEGHGVPTLVFADLFAYLCVHGATHGWSRLKWLSDVAALLSCRTPDEVVGLYEHASARGAERQAAAALLLCSDLFGIRLRSDQDAALRYRVLIRWLVGNAQRSYVGRNETIEMDAMPLSTLRIHFAQIVATRGLRERGRLITAKIERDREYGGPGRWPIAIGRWIAGRFDARRHLRA